MAERKIVFTKLATEQITAIHESLLAKGAIHDAEDFMDDFLDVAFSEIPAFSDKYPVVEGVSSQEGDYRIASLYNDFRIIFQTLKDKVLILLILHEGELPF
ncbi:MAG: hypothetical protein MRZ79_23125 [Bacteroidia bacterium]|nr:hypothetical protein [Bacteroidia bacterium]